MTLVADIIQFENNCARSFAAVSERDFGWLYHDRDNPASHDSNHARILDLNADLSAAIREICVFYETLGARPRVFQAHVSGETEILHPKLRAAHFEITLNPDRFFAWSEPSAIKPVAGFQLRRAREMNAEVIAVIGAEETWSLGVVRRQITRKDYHLLIGYVGDTAVAMADLDLAPRLSRVDGVKTRPEYRQRGYGRALLHGVVHYHQQLSRNPLYLYSRNPDAFRIYQEAGFREISLQAPRWSAWLPAAGSSGARQKTAVKEIISK